MRREGDRADGEGYKGEERDEERRGGGKVDGRRDVGGEERKERATLLRRSPQRPSDL